MLNYPYMAKGIENAAFTPNDIPHSQIGVIRTAAEVFQRLPALSMLICLSVALMLLPRNHRPQNISYLGNKIPLGSILIYFLGSLTIVYYYVLSGHILGLERKLAITSLFVSPAVAFGIVWISIKAKLFARFDIGLLAIVTTLAMFGLYAYAQPFVQYDERAFINMEEVLNVIERQISSNEDKKALVAYVSDENVWYLKQQLEARSDLQIHVDETAPWGSDWREKVEGGWRPDILAGILVSRYATEVEQREAEYKELARLSLYGYRLLAKLPVSDAILGNSNIYVLTYEKAPVGASVNLEGLPLQKTTSFPRGT